MKRRGISVICALALALAGTPPAFADESSPTPDPAAVFLDLVLVRPISLAATLLGGAFFVLGLPIAAASNSVHRTAEALVLWPAHMTFTRPLGEFDDTNGY